MDLSNEIDKAKVSVAILASEYSSDATYGHARESDLFRIMQINAMIRAVENNIPCFITVKRKKLEVPLSSLQRDGNSLILDQSRLYECEDVEVRRCLSDEEVCTLVENLQAVCNNTNC